MTQVNEDLVDRQFSTPDRAVLYARVSKDDRSTDGRNLQGQLDMGREHAESKHYKIVAEFAEDDRGASGYEIDLPKLNKIREMARDRTFDVLIVRELDRLSRNLAKQLIVEEELRRCGVRIEYVLAEYDDTPEGRLSKHIRATIAEYEREKIRERMLRGRTLKVQSGKVIIAGRPPYGYKASDDREALLVDEPQAKVVRMIFDWYAYGENGTLFSLKAIARKLNALNISTPKGGTRWDSSTIKIIIENETYIGTWYYGKAYQKNGRVHQNPRSTWIAVDVPSIVDHQVFKVANIRRTENKARAARNTRHKYLLAGRLSCHLCKKSVRCRNSCNKKKKGYEYKYKYYDCSNRDDHKACDLPHFRADKVDAKVWDWIKSIFKNKHKLRENLKKYQAEQEKYSEPLLERLEVVKSLLSENRKKQERLLDQTLAGLFDEDMLADRKNRLDATKTGLEQERDKLVAQLKVQTLTDDQICEIEQFAAKIRKGIDEADKNFDARRRLIELLDVQASLEGDDSHKIIHARCIVGTKSLPIEYNTIGGSPPPNRRLQ